MGYKTFLIWPYAVASAVAGVIFAFLFAPSVGIITFALKQIGIHWNWVLRGDQAMILVVVASIWKQISYNFLFFLAGLQSIPKSLIEAAAIDGAGPIRRFWTVVFPLLTPTTFFLLVINIVYAFFDTFGVIDATTQGGPAGATQHPRLQGLSRRREVGRPRRLVGAVGDADDHRDRADRRPVSLHRAQGALLMNRSSSLPGPEPLR